VYTSLSEKRKRDEDAKVLRQTLGVELRRLSNDALSSYMLLNAAKKPLREDFHHLISTEEVSDSFRIARPIIYPNVAAQIASIGANASRVVYFYSRLEECRDRVARLRPREKVSDSEFLEISTLLRGVLRAASDARTSLEPVTEGTNKDDTRFRGEVERLLPPHD
jgi:hypothetical protein